MTRLNREDQNRQDLTSARPRPLQESAAAHCAPAEQRRCEAGARVYRAAMLRGVLAVVSRGCEATTAVERSAVLRRIEAAPWGEAHQAKAGARGSDGRAPTAAPTSSPLRP